MTQNKNCSISEANLCISCAYCIYSDASSAPLLQNRQNWRQYPAALVKRYSVDAVTERSSLHSAHSIDPSLISPEKFPQQDQTG